MAGSWLVDRARCPLPCRMPQLPLSSVVLFCKQLSWLLWALCFLPTHAELQLRQLEDGPAWWHHSRRVQLCTYISRLSFHPASALLLSLGKRMLLLCPALAAALLFLSDIAHNERRWMDFFFSSSPISFSWCNKARCPIDGT